MDVLSDLLRVIRLKGALFLNADFREPWCVHAPGGADAAVALGAGAQDVAICHLVVEGTCRVQLPGQSALVLEAGDVAVFPRGDAHLIGAGLSGGLDLLPRVAIEMPRLAHASYGGDGPVSTLVCGWFGHEPHIAKSMTASLPPIFTTRIRERQCGPWLEQAIRYAALEASSGRPGGGAMASHLAEVLFLEALRGHIESLPEVATGWLAGLRDPQVGRCIALMHERPAERWTVASLAQEVHVSRTVLAERFTDLVGVPPIQYLKRWRAALAASLLASTQAGLARIAEQVGYESEAALCRAFKAEYGVPPGTWRRRSGANHRPGAPGNAAAMS